MHFKAFGRGIAAWEPLSIMVSSALCMFQTTRRSPPLRARPFSLIRSMIEDLVQFDIELTTTLIDTYGVERVHTFSLVSAHVDATDVWDVDFFQQWCHTDWGVRLNDASYPWVASPWKQPHLADWLAYVLDLPQSERIKTNVKDVVAAKQLYSSSALNLVTQLTFAFDEHCASILQSSDRKKFNSGEAVLITYIVYFNAMFLRCGY